MVIIESIQVAEALQWKKSVDGKFTTPLRRLIQKMPS